VAGGREIVEMSILQPLFDLVETLYGQVVSIPLDNPLSYVYVVVNLILLIIATLGGIGG